MGQDLRPPYSHIAHWVAAVYPDLVSEPEWADVLDDSGHVTNQGLLLSDRGFFACEMDEFNAATQEQDLEVIGLTGPPVRFKARTQARRKQRSA